MSLNQVLQIAKLMRELFIPMVSISLEICLNRVLDFRANFDSSHDCSGTRGDKLVWPDSRQKCDLSAFDCPQDESHFAKVGKNGQICRAVSLSLIMASLDESWYRSMPFGSLLISVYQYNLYI